MRRGIHRPTGETVTILGERTLWDEHQYLIRFARGLTTWWSAAKVDLL